MRRRLGRWSKFAAVWLAMSLVLLDSAWAGRRRCCKPECSCPPPACDCSSGGVESDVPPAHSPSDQPAPPAPITEPPAETPAPPPAVDPAAPSPPVAEPAAPAPPAEPAPSKPDNFDNLFPAAEPAKPAQPASPPPAKAPETPKATAPAPSPDEDDPFAPAKPAAAKPATAPAPAAPKAPPVDDDPFAPPPPKPAPAPAKPAVDPAKRAADPAANPFQISADGQLPLREWVDDSGQFRVQGRLIAILDGNVRILKETGRTTTVSMSRLSTADTAYVALAKP